MKNANEIVFVDLREDGLLWLINRCLFHPVGHALAIDQDDRFRLLGDGGEPWVFPSWMTDEAEPLARARLGDEIVDRLIATYDGSQP